MRKRVLFLENTRAGSVIVAKMRRFVSGWGQKDEVEIKGL
jgi:hypothetical protein